MQCNKMLEAEEFFYDKEEFRFYILFGLKIGQKFKMEICLLSGGGQGKYYQTNSVKKFESYLSVDPKLNIHI